MKSTVLHLIPYSLHGDTHGGKIRVGQISKVLREEFHHLETIEVHKLNFRADEQEKNYFGVSDSLIGDLKMLNRGFEFPTQNLEDIKVIVFEHPWPWGAVKKLQSMYPHSKIVYSSHNVEWKLKQEILRPYIGSRANDISLDIRQTEIEIAKNVDYVVTVSEHDRDWYAQYSKSTPILSPNGTHVFLEQSKVNIEKSENSSYAIVVGSAHPPNIEGCLRLLADPDLWLPYQTRIKVVGSLSDALRQNWGNLTNRWGQPCIEFMGVIDSDVLHEQIVGSRAVLLPIPYGGGTNLKTAEALVSQRPIIATANAFRGYDSHLRDQNVFITNNSVDFKIAIINRLRNEYVPNARREVSDLSWDATLNGFRKLMRTLVNG